MIYHNTDGALMLSGAGLQNDHHRILGVVLRRGHAKAPAQIHDGHDESTQVDHPEHILRSAGDPGGFFPDLDLAHPQDLHAIFLIGQDEAQVLIDARGLVNGKIDTEGFCCRAHDDPYTLCFAIATPWALRSCRDRRMSPTTSRMRATEPSLRMVAPERPVRRMKLRSRLLITACC